MSRTSSTCLQSSRWKTAYRGLAERRRLLAGAAALTAVAALLPTGAAMPAVADDETTGSESAVSAPLPELATATSNTVREVDGSLTMTAYTEPVNYQDASGQWVPIDNTLVDAPGDVYDVQNAANSFTAKIPEDPSTTPIKLIDGGAWVTMQMNGIADNPAHVDDDTASFDDVAKADGVEYQVTNTGLKESITLDSAPSAPLHYTYTIDASTGLTPTMDDAGNIAVADPDGVTAFTVPAGVMFDSAGEDGSDSDDVDYSLTSTGSAWTLTVTPDIDWLTDPSRVYPVVIDPSLNGQNDVHDCNLRSAVPDGSACGNQTVYLKAGRSDSTHKYRGVFDFDVTSIPSTATVTNATVHLNLDASQTLDQTQSADYALYAAGKKFDGSATWNSSGASGSWNGGSPGTTTYAIKPMKGDSAGDKPFSGLEGLVQSWVSNAGNNTGLVVKQVGETTDNILNFYSNSSSNAAAKRPYIDINYTSHPTTPTSLSFTPCLDDCDPIWTFTNSLTPTLHAKSFDDDTSTLTYSWQIRDSETQTSIVTGTTTGAQGTLAAWTVPTGYLSDSHIYEYRVSASDGVSSQWTAWTMMGVDINQAPDTPTSMSLSPCVGDDCTTTPPSTTSKTPTLTGVISDQDDDLLTGDFQVRLAGTTSLVASGTTQTATGIVQYPVPAGLLSYGSTYEFRVGAADAQSETWSAWTSFAVAAPSGPSEPTGLAMSCGSPCLDTWVSGVSTPTFSASSAEVSQSEALVFQVRSSNDSQSGTVSGVAPHASASWTVPNGVLGADIYSVRVGAQTGAGTTWTAWRAFAVDSSATTATNPSLDSATPDTADNPDYDPNRMPDSTKDGADSGSISTYSDSDLDALDAAADVDTANAKSAGLSENSESLTGRQVPIQAKYAPKMWIESEDKDNPLSALTFLNHSDLRWAHDGSCKDDDLGKSPDAAKIGSGGFSDHEESSRSLFGGCDKQTTTWYSNSSHVAVDASGGPSGREGMFLDLDGPARTGYERTKREPVYYDYHAKSYIQYWFVWGENYAPILGSAASVFDNHEGDWENIAIKLDSSNNPTVVQYAYHTHSCTLPWSEAPRLHGHPKVWFGKGSHASYPANAKTPALTSLGVHDTIDGTGPVWFANANLQNARTQDWWGYEGNWGEIGARPNGYDLHNTGPVGAGPDKDVYPGFTSSKCQLN